MKATAPLRVHWVRHGEVVSHRGDLPVIEHGKRQIEIAGQQFASTLIPGETVALLHAPTRRTQETAFILHESMAKLCDDMQRSQVRLLEPVEHWAIRNPDIYIAGTRIELVSSAEALAEQLPPSTLSPEELAQIPFLHGFWSTPDRIGYWVSHPDPPGEDADTVAHRLLTFATSLLDLPLTRPLRYICVTHSPPMRAFLRRYLLEYDPGEPEYAESIDLEFVADGSCMIRYRQEHKVVKR